MKPNGKRRRWANRILATAAVLYAIVFVGQLYIANPWYEALYWLVQSALIGSVADWFAVTALFRKPLGIGFHTELIPRHKERLIEGIVTLAETRLLTIERCKRALADIHFMPLLERYITSQTGRRQLRQLIHRGLTAAWEKKSEQEWAAWGAERLREVLRHRSVNGPLQQMLTDVCKHNAHEATIIKLLGELQSTLDRPNVLHWLTVLIDEEIQKKKANLLKAIVIGLSEATDIINARDMAVSLLRELYMILERWKQPGSRERLVWMQQWIEPVQAMAYNSTVTGTLDGAFHRWVDEQNWEYVLAEYICPRVTELLATDAWDGFAGGRDAAAATDDEIMTESAAGPAAVLEASLQDMWRVYSRQPEVRGQIESICHRLAEYLLTHGHALLGVVVRQVLGALSTEKFIWFIESKVEDDLSWIRINGALVGGVCGLGAWGFLHFVYEPLLRTIGLQ